MARDELLASPVEALWDGQAPSHVATRARNGLARQRIGTIGDLIARSAADLVSPPWPGRSRLFGAACLAEVRRVLKARGLALKGDRVIRDDMPRDALGRPYEVRADGDALVIDTTGPLRLALDGREAFEQAYKQAVAEVDDGV